MKFTLDELRNTKAGKLPDNQELLAQLSSPKPKQADRSQGPHPSPPSSQGGLGRQTVTITSFRSRLLDDDNCQGGVKALRDRIAEYLGLDDSQRFIDWRYEQVIQPWLKGTLVEITTQPIPQPQTQNCLD